MDHTDNLTAGDIAKAHATPHAEFLFQDHFQPEELTGMVYYDGNAIARTTGGHVLRIRTLDLINDGYGMVLEYNVSLENKDRPARRSRKYNEYGLEIIEDTAHGAKLVREVMERATTRTA